MRQTADVPTTADPYLLGLVLEDRPVLVVGAGAVAERRVAALLAARARVRVVAPTATPALRERVVAGELVWEPRGYAGTDVEGVWFVLAATDDRTVNAVVAEEAERRRVFCVRADDADGGTARTPATGTAGGVLLGLLTRRTDGHGDPGRLRALRDALVARLGELTGPA